MFPDWCRRITMAISICAGRTAGGTWGQVKIDGIAGQANTISFLSCGFWNILTKCRGNVHFLLSWHYHDNIIEKSKHISVCATLPNNLFEIIWIFNLVILILQAWNPHRLSFEVIAPWENHWRKVSAVRCPALMTPLLCQAGATNLWALGPELPPKVSFRKPVRSIPSTPLNPKSPQIIHIIIPNHINYTLTSSLQEIGWSCNKSGSRSFWSRRRRQTSPWDLGRARQDNDQMPKRWEKLESVWGICLKKYFKSFNTHCGAFFESGLCISWELEGFSKALFFRVRSGYKKRPFQKGPQDLWTCNLIEWGIQTSNICTW